MCEINKNPLPSLTPRVGREEEYGGRVDRGDRDHNVMDQAAVSELEKAIEKLASDDSIRGVAITSAKRTFFAGGNLKGAEFAHTQVTEEDVVAVLNDAMEIW